MEFNWEHGKGCKVAVIEASINGSTQKPITTFLMRYWRAIHAEVMTHRVFSRNASSTRAIPTAKLIADIRNDPAGPVFWGKNQPGMQAREELPEGTLVRHPVTGEWLSLKDAWRAAANAAADWAEAFTNAGVHKQIAGRGTEPYGWITVCLTSTEWDNWYELRDHKDAQPEIQDLAFTMKVAQAKATFRKIDHYKMQDARSWHLPFVTMEERKSYPVTDLIRMSTARCARTSYNNHDQSNPEVQKDIKLHDDLVVAEPIHASPSEHQACATPEHLSSGNFQGGWGQYRKLLEVHGWEKIEECIKLLKRNESTIMLSR
ncbi:hypothetical protein [Burkholderia phage BCSR5]|nr:hypothetical protein [Burkholderia phage BCSR5]